MPIAFTPGGLREYVLEDDRPERNESGELVAGMERPTVFLLRNLTLRERQESLQLMKQALRGDGSTLEELEADFDKAATVARIGLAGWRDFPKAEGGELAYECERWTAPGGAERDAVKRELLDCLSVNDLLELAGAITAQSQVKGADLGN